ncbi:MAG: ion transporter [Eubacteriales bacterium]|nr:ion transporter [Eubacteriales bacterium]
MESKPAGITKQNIKKRTFEIIQIGNRNDTLSLAADILIVVAIFINIACMFLETFDEMMPVMGIIRAAEYVTILVFAIEYLLRIWTAEYLYPKESKHSARLHFLRSFDGIVDLTTILPFFFLTGFVVFRMLRVVRIFHLFRINSQYDSFNVITSVLYEKKNQIISSVFIILVLMFASSICMYSVEHEAQPEAFKNAFSGIWWSMSTLLTVGYGDIYPVTFIGRIMAIIIAFLGVGVVAIPTGIISAGFVEQYQRFKNLEDVTAHRNVDFLTISVKPGHNLCGVTVAEANFPQGLALVLIVREGKTIGVSGSTTIMEGDNLVIAGENYTDELGIRLKEVYISSSHEWAGKKVRELDISRLTTLVSIERKDQVIIPNGDTEIHGGDLVIMYSRK